MRGKSALVFLALLFWSSVAPAVEKGEPLASALEELRGSGLRLIFSSALIHPDLLVEVDPGTGSAEEVARRILEPHGLTLDAIRPGVFSVVRGADPVAGAVPGQAPGKPESDPGRALSSVRGPLYEVGVYASRYQIDDEASTAALRELSREDMEALPGLNEDVLRVTRFLPGTASSSISARSHVRGGRDDELAVFFDGVPLFEPFHYKDVQSLLGILDPGSISGIEFFSGVFPARYGNRLSGVLDVKPRQWTGESYNALGASVLYSHAMSHGRTESYPFEWLASVRRGNIELFSDLLDRRETQPDFLDALVRVQLDTGPRSTFSAGWLLLDDVLDVVLENNVERGDFEYRDATAWASWSFRPGDTSELRASVSRTERHTNREGALNREGGAIGSLDDHRRFDTSTLRVEGSIRAASRLTLNGGLEWYDYQAFYDYESRTQLDPVLAEVFGHPATRRDSLSLIAGGQAYATYASALVEVSPRVLFDFALRWDAQRFDGDFNDNQLSPRVSVQYHADPATVLRLSWGRMAQTERPDELQVQDGDAVFHPAQHSTQSAVSIERRVGAGALVRLEAYDKRVSDPAPVYENLLDPFALLPELEADRVRVQPDRSRLYGVELSARWQSARAWSSWASYSWSEAKDFFDNVSVPRTWDQRHAVTTGLAWTNRPWQLSANLAWHSGWRRNELVSTPEGVQLAPRNARAWSDYLSLDLRAAWTRALPKGAIEVFGEVDNATNHANPCCSSYTVLPSASAGGVPPQNTTWLPRLYLIGVTWQLP